MCVEISGCNATLKDVSVLFQHYAARLTLPRAMLAVHGTLSQTSVDK